MNGEGKDGMTPGRAFTTFSAVVLAGLLFTIFIASIVSGSMSVRGVRTIIYLILMAGVFAVFIQMITEWFLKVNLQGRVKERIRQALFRMFELFSMVTVVVIAFLFLLAYVLPGGQNMEINAHAVVLFLLLVDVFVLILALSIAYEKKEIEDFIQKMKEKRESEN